MGLAGGAVFVDVDVEYSEISCLGRWLGGMIFVSGVLATMVLVLLLLSLAKECGYLPAGTWWYYTASPQCSMQLQDR